MSRKLPLAGIRVADMTTVVFDRAARKYWPILALTSSRSSRRKVTARATLACRRRHLSWDRCACGSTEASGR